MKWTHVFTAWLVVLILAIPATAQTGGQLCVRSFEDRNLNGVLDPGEPLLIRGISANLLDGSGVTVQTALLDDSARAAQGIMCFQGLSAGQYTISLASADYTPTASNAFPANVTDSSVEIFDFGAILATGETPATAEEIAQDRAITEQGEISQAQLARIFVSAAGGAVAFGVLTVLGVLIYAIFVRPRQQDSAPYPPQGYYGGDTGPYRPVQGDTGAYYPPQNPTGDTGAYYPPPTDTGPYRPVQGDTGAYYPPTADTGPYRPPQPPPGDEPR